MHHFFILSLMVHTVTTLSYPELNKFLYNTFTGNPIVIKPNVLSVRPMCKLLLLLLLLSSSSFTNAVQISVSTTNVIKGTQPQLECHKTNTDGHFTNSSAIYHIHFIASHHLSHVDGKSTVRPIKGNDDADGK